MATLPTITSGISTAGNILLAVPQTAGLLGSQVSETIGYQPQGSTTTAAANILGTTNGTLAAIFSPPPALVFDYEGEQKLSLDSDITDHFVENNTAIQDQISLKPIIISTQGFIGELTDTPPNKVFQLAQIAANKLSSLGQYTPSLSVTALEAYNQAFSLYQTAINAANEATAAFSSVSGGVTGESVVSNGQVSQVAAAQNRQQTMFQRFLGYRSNRVLFTIQTPWAVFQNCAILSLSPIQDAATQVITEFAVTFKQIRFASSVIGGSETPTIGLGRSAAITSPTVSNGVTSLTNPSPTTLTSIIPQQ